METTRKNNDCYFFYYSTCTKGNNCAFRHEPSALGCEVMCQYWQQGNCLNEHCNFRHMELKKNRKSIQCFWESQRGGCKKPHCPFLHTSSRPAPNADAGNPIKTTEVTAKPVTQEWSNRPDDAKYDGSGTESDQGRGSSEAGSFIGSPAVDPLIVNFDEESDNESAPSPVKAQTARVPYCKTYEENRLEEIQAESAAYYSYEPADYPGSVGGGKEKRVTSVRAARSRMVSLYPREKPGKSREEHSTDFEVLTLDEIRRRKAAKESEDPRTNEETLDTRKTKETDNFLKDAIKSLEELRASTNVEKSVLVTRKRRADTRSSQERETESKACKITKVPPIRLRRSPKRFCRSAQVSDASVSTDRDDTDMGDTEEKKLDASVENRSQEIEKRLCDSTCDDARTATSDIRENDEDSPSNVTAEDLKLEQLDETGISVNEDEYLATVDPASEDILKDIDALLTEKTSV